MKTIHLVLRYRWFDMIAHGSKREDYREIKPYYEKLRDLKMGDGVVFHKGYSSVTVTAKVRYCFQAYGITSWGGDPEKNQWVIGFSLLSNETYN